ncbi:MAG: hypothetical protein ABJ239_02060 [Erythrobacter sp.]
MSSDTMQSRPTGQSHPTGTRGRPLAMLVLVLLAWGCARIVTWEAPWPQVENLVPKIVAGDANGSASSIEQGSSVQGLAQGEPAQQASAPRQGLSTPPHFGAVQVEGLTEVPHPSYGASDIQFADPLVAADGQTATAAGHQMMWMAAMTHLPIPASIEHSLNSLGLQHSLNTQAENGRPQEGAPDRWSLEAWAFWRQGSNSTLVSQGRAPTYGANQVGAVLNYRLAPSSKRDPRAYVRAYRALIDNGETELSAGLSARPVAKIPLRAHAELRAIERSNGGGTKLRPSAFATTELEPIDLLLGARAEVYAQAGYVGGDGATAFADGQVHVLRDVGQFDLARFSLGAAAWGGAQKGAERVDIGPSVRVDMTIGQVPARLSVDYRERVAGSAEPDSGAAVTLSTRF